MTNLKDTIEKLNAKISARNKEVEKYNLTVDGYDEIKDFLTDTIKEVFKICKGGEHQREGFTRDEIEQLEKEYFK